MIALSATGVARPGPALTTAPAQSLAHRRRIRGRRRGCGVRAGRTRARLVRGWPASSGLVAGVGGLGVGAGRARRELLDAWVLDQACGPRHLSVGQVAAAVADALGAARLTGGGSEAVVVEVPGGEHRCRLDAAEDDAQLFATALDERSPPSPPRATSSPATRPRPPRVPDGTRLRTPSDAAAALTRLRPDAVAWHAVPDMLAANAARAHASLDAWSHWVGDGKLLFTQCPAGAGVLAAQQGADPFDVTTVMRRHWR